VESVPAVSVPEVLVLSEPEPVVVESVAVESVDETLPDDDPSEEDVGSRPDVGPGVVAGPPVVSVAAPAEPLDVPSGTPSSIGLSGQHTGLGFGESQRNARHSTLVPPAASASSDPQPTAHAASSSAQASRKERRGGMALH